MDYFINLWEENTIAVIGITVTILIAIITWSFFSNSKGVENSTIQQNQTASGNTINGNVTGSNVTTNGNITVEASVPYEEKKSTKN